MHSLPQSTHSPDGTFVTSDAPTLTRRNHPKSTVDIPLTALFLSLLFFSLEWRELGFVRDVQGVQEVEPGSCPVHLAFSLSRFQSNPPYSSGAVLVSVLSGSSRLRTQVCPRHEHQRSSSPLSAKACHLSNSTPYLPKSGRRKKQQLHNSGRMGGGKNT